MEDQPKKRGGARSGAGRPAKRGETDVLRVPVAYREAIQALIERLDNTQHVNRHYQPVRSEPLFMRSLLGKPQHITFTTVPVGVEAPLLRSYEKILEI